MPPNKERENKDLIHSRRSLCIQRIGVGSGATTNLTKRDATLTLFFTGPFIELGPLPVPAPGYLWQEKDEKRWRQQYDVWLDRWKSGFYRMEELFWIKPGCYMDERSEMWLAEVDEYGMLLMAEGECSSTSE